MNKGMGWVWLVFAPLSLSASVALAGAFDGLNATTAPLQCQGFSNDSIGVAITNPQFGGTIAAAQFFVLIAAAGLALIATMRRRQTV